MLVGRAPSVQPEALVALQVAERVVRLPSLTCALRDADKLAVFLPITAAGQHEAGARLCVAANLTHNAALVGEIRPRMDAMLALALLAVHRRDACHHPACGAVCADA